MAGLQKLSTGWKAITQLGPTPVLLNGLYRLGLRSGHFRRVTPPIVDNGPAYPLRLEALLPTNFAAAYREFYAAYPAQVQETLEEAQEILSGRVRLFGGKPVELNLAPAQVPLRHWSEYEGGKPGEDPKLAWEPARFGWALTLARAYLLTFDDGYAQYFWRKFETFADANPANLGPNWVSAQEVALRLISVALAASIFQPSPESTPARLARLAWAIAQHATRIPPTMLYARSQHNNHLLTESAGLLTAAAVLPDHPSAPAWRQSGQKWLERGLLEQISADGTYSQHSSNYHRLMLQTALWGEAILKREGQEYSAPLRTRLAAAARWLLARIDVHSGGCLNLGSNDGAYILPLAPGGIHDYRPATQAAALAFLGQPAFLPGSWDEFSLWLGLPPAQVDPLPVPGEMTILRGGDSWASLRAVRFTSRPSQADQLHVDLWWRGAYLARDAGSYRYTAPHPWDNALGATRAHNTVTLDLGSQMRRAGRFLWLDWAQARILNSQPDQFVEAEHDGYRAQGMIHRRRLERAAPDQWLVTDWLLPTRGHRRQHMFTLHWLLPDWPWTLDGSRLELSGPPGKAALDVRVEAAAASLLGIRLLRCGKDLLTSEESGGSTLGWWSPTYNQKLPAISMLVEVGGSLPVHITTHFTLQPGGE